MFHQIHLWVCSDVFNVWQITMSIHNKRQIENTATCGVQFLSECKTVYQESALLHLILFLEIQYVLLFHLTSERPE